MRGLSFAQCQKDCQRDPERASARSPPLSMVCTYCTLQSAQSLLTGVRTNDRARWNEVKHEPAVTDVVAAKVLTRLHVQGVVHRARQGKAKHKGGGVGGVGGG